MKSLANMLSTADGEDKVLKRLQVIDMARGILNSIAIDTDGEEYDFKTLQMSGVKDVIDSTCNMLSAVTNIPQTILFGRSPAGENSTGESDLENYYNMVENIQKQNMKSNARIVIDLILRQGMIEGKIQEIPKYKVKFAALWSMSEIEKSTVQKTKADTEYIKAQTLQIYMDNNVIDPSEVRKSLVSEGKFYIDKTSSKEKDELELLEDAFDVLSIQTCETNDTLEEKMDGEDYPAAAVLIIKEGKILCASRRNQEGLCGPGGHVEEGETSEEAAVREAQEEFHIVPLNLIPLGEYKGDTGSYMPSMVYVTDKFTGTPKADGVEMLNERWMSIEELQNQLLFPPFKDSLNLLIKLLLDG